MRCSTLHQYFLLPTPVDVPARLLHTSPAASRCKCPLSPAFGAWREQSADSPARPPARIHKAIVGNNKSFVRCVADIARCAFRNTFHSFKGLPECGDERDSNKVRMHPTSRQDDLYRSSPLNNVVLRRAHLAARKRWSSVVSKMTLKSVRTTSKDPSRIPTNLPPPYTWTGARSGHLRYVAPARELF
jgi:hypothetical protein